MFYSNVSSKTACEQLIDAIDLRQKKANRSPLVRMPGITHCAVFAPTGAGKGVSFVIPFLQTCSESAIVVDFKGENYLLTSEHRRRLFGHRIVVIDPFRVVSKSPDTFNPIQFIDQNSSTAIDECRALAESLVIRSAQEHERHWGDSAELWLATLMALVVHYGEAGDRSLQTVQTLLTNPTKLAMAIKLACSSEAWDGMLSRMGHQLTHYKDRELSSTLTTTSRFLNFLGTQAIAECTKTSSFNPAELLNGKMTCYLILPPEHMRAQSPLLRMWIGSLLRAVVRGGLQDKHRVHFLLDEAASLKHLEALDDAVDKYRGYGVRLIFMFQALSQLKACFPDGQDQTLLSNVSQVFFGVNDIGTAEFVSKRLGDETIIVKSGGTTDGTSRQYSDSNSGNHGDSKSENNNWNQLGRNLLKPDEVLNLPGRIAITFTPGVPPVCTRLVRYYEEHLSKMEPDKPERFWAVATILTKSVIMLILAGLAAHSIFTRDARSDVQQEIQPIERKGESWPRETLLK